MLSKLLKHIKNGTILQIFFKKSSHLHLNITNKLKYGLSAPRYAERIWVNPKKCDMFLAENTIKELCGVSNVREASGKVIETSWPVEQAIPITETPKFKFCFQRIVNGVPWKDTGAYEFQWKSLQEKEGSLLGCKNMVEIVKRYENDIVKRYENLDRIIEMVKREGRLRTKQEINSFNYLEEGGIFVHLGPNGQLFFGGGGKHRFAMAYILDLTIIPAQIGCVHVKAIPFLDSLRKAKPLNH